MSDLHAAAAAAGLQRDWEDADSRPQRVADEVLATVLDRLDLSAATEPFLSADAGRPIALPGGASGPAVLVLEDGTSRPLTVNADGRVPGIDTIGYHRLEVGGQRFTLAVAPTRCPVPSGRGWGSAVQIPALRGARSSAYGDLGTLAEAAAAFGRAGAAALAISPTHALFPADPGRFSPYAPSTRLFHNVLLADPALIGAPLQPAAAPDLIDWQQAIPARMAHLRAAWAGAGTAVREKVAAFRAERGPSLEGHATFDALHSRFGGGWRDWPSEFRAPDAAAVRRFAAEQADEIALFAFLQWLADRGLATAQAAAREHMPIGLIADLAVGMDPGGSHGWSRRHELLRGLSIGAPPDPLGPEGQNWGITALDPFALRRTGFVAFIETLRAALTHAGGIRIDHALGLQRLWVVPEGAPASDGVYLTMPGDDMKRIIAIEATRANAIVIAEDLGTVPPGFRDELAARGMLGMRVLPFERDKQGDFVPPAEWDAEAVAMTGTHDTPTLAGWWTGRDIEWNRKLGRSGASEAEAGRPKERASLWRAMDGRAAPPEQPPVDTILAAVADAPAPLAIVPLEDLAGLEEQPNIPGTIDEHPNWRRRMAKPTEALLARPDIARRTSLLTEARPG